MYNFFKYLFVLCFLISSSSLLEAQWNQTKGPEGGYILSFAYLDSNIYVGTDGGGVYISKDGGANWNQTNAGLKNFKISALAVSGKDLFAAVLNTRGGSSVYISSNGGESWAPAGNGLQTDPNIFFEIDCFAVYSDSAGGTRIFAGAYDGGIYVSTDNGENWVPDTLGLINKFVLSLTIKDTNIYAGTIQGVYRSTINTASWEPAGIADMDWFPSIKSVVVLDSILYASGGSIYRSTNNGDSWIKVNENNTGPLVSFGTELFAGTYDGTILRSSDKGLSWTGSNLPMSRGWVESIEAIGTNLFAGTLGGGVFISTDHGVNWTAINNGLKNPKVNCIAVIDSNIFVGTPIVGVFLSTDNGDSWSQVNNGLNSLDVVNVVGLAASGSNLFAGVLLGGVFKSTDYGKNWIQVGKDISHLGNDYAIAAIDTNIFVGVIPWGVYRSTDDGSNWAIVDSGLANTFVAALAASDSNLFAGTLHGVFRTTNEGVYWTYAGLNNYSVAALTVNGADLYAKTDDAELFVSTNYGTTWTKFDSGSVSENIISLAANQSNLYAGSSMGVIYRSVSGITDVQQINHNLPELFSLYQNYPNPFNPATRIRYEIPKASFVSLKIYDLLGREVATLVNEEKQAGSYEVEFDGSNLSSGIYFYRMQAGSYINTKKFVLLK